MQDLLPTTDALAELRRNPSPFRERMDRRSAAGRLTFLHGSLSSSCCPICDIRRGQRLKVSVPSFRFRVLNRWPKRTTKPLHSWRGGITDVLSFADHPFRQIDGLTIAEMSSDKVAVVDPGVVDILSGLRLGLDLVHDIAFLDDIVLDLDAG